MIDPTPVQTGMYDVLKALVENLPAIIAAIAAIASIIVNHLRAKEVKAELTVAKDEIRADAQQQAAEIGHVKVLVNGNLDREKQENARLRAKLAENNIESD